MKGPKESKGKGGGMTVRAGGSFLPGSGGFQPLNMRVQNNMCSHTKRAFLYSVYALKHLLSRERGREVRR